MLSKQAISKKIGAAANKIWKAVTGGIGGTGKYLLS